jgi:hypothetical protein
MSKPKWKQDYDPEWPLALKVRCSKCGEWKEAKGAWCPNYRSHGSTCKIKQKRWVNPPAEGRAE